MDLNNRLIEAVRQYPLLYKNNVSLSDRKCSWQQIAQQMKVQEALLKSRWHFLREHYRRYALTDNQVATHQFPYKKEMEFLLPYLRPPPREAPQSEEEILPISIIKPEFVITEKDLENDSGSEEYVFLEVEALGSEYETNEAAQLNESDLRKELQGLEHDQEHEPELQHQEDDADESGQIEVEVHIKQEQTVSQPLHNGNQIATRLLKEEKQEFTCNRSGATEDEAVRSQIQEAAQEKVESKVEVREGDSSSDNIVADRNVSSGERGEDAIFGELVSAMLMKLPAEKKRAIKRDIMNLLLT